jgi:DNA-directed RNA polymerase specialized sigma24 family protein
MRTNGDMPSHRAPVVSRAQQDERRLIRNVVSAQHVAHSDVEDIVQEVMIAAAGSAHTFSVPQGWTLPRARSAWLRAIALRSVARYWRRRMRDDRLDFRADVPSGNWHGPGFAPSAEALALARTAIVRLHDGLSLLRESAPAVHAVVAAHDLDELPIGRVAALLGITESTAWNRLHLGRQALRAHCLRLAAQQPWPLGPPRALRRSSRGGHHQGG